MQYFRTQIKGIHENTYTSHIATLYVFPGGQLNVIRTLRRSILRKLCTLKVHDTLVLE